MQNIISAIYSSYPRNEPCPCGNPQKAKNCCLQSPGNWNKEPSQIIPRNGPTLLENAKCYAKNTSDCCDKISGEHYISKNILEIVNENRGVVPIEGLVWIPNGESRVMPNKSLVANILCKRHNEALSPLDSEAGKLVRFVGSFDKDFNSSNPKEEVKILCGEDVERWMLKTVCGLVAGNQLGKEGVPLKAEIKNVWIDILYGKSTWPESWGLYLSSSKDTIQHSDSFAFVPMTHPQTQELKGAELYINNFKFYLLLGRPDNPDAFGIHRPRTLIFRQKNIKKYIELTWQDKTLNKFVLFDRIGTYDGEPENFKKKKDN